MERLLAVAGVEVVVVGVLVVVVDLSRVDLDLDLEVVDLLDFLPGVEADFLVFLVLLLGGRWESDW